MLDEQKGDRIWLILCTTTGVVVDVTLNKYSSRLPDLVVLGLWAIPLIIFTVWLWHIEKTRGRIKRSFLEHPVSYIVLFLIFLPFAYQATTTMISKLRSSSPVAKPKMTTIPLVPSPQPVLVLPSVHTANSQPTTELKSKPHRSQPADKSITSSEPAPASMLHSPASSPTRSEAITADHGIAIGGNAHVQNPTVNNFVPSERKLQSIDHSDLVEILRQGNSDMVDVSAPAGDNEAQQLGVNIYTLFQESGWKMKNPIVMSYLKVGGPIAYGITVFIHGEPVKQTTEITLPTNHPLMLIQQVFRKEGLLYTMQMRPSTPEGQIDVEIGTNPPT